MAQGIEKYANKRLKARILAGDEPPWLVKHKRRRYIVLCVLSAPDWVRPADFAALRKLAEDASRIAAEPYRLDHIIPLAGEGVCGLTVPWNIQVIPHRCNVAKSNKWAPDQMAFEFPEAFPPWVLNRQPTLL